MEGKIALEEHVSTDLNNAMKLKTGRENAARLFSLDLPALPERAAAGFAA